MMKTETGRVVRSLSGFYEVQTPGGLVTCRGRGSLRRTGESPLTLPFYEKCGFTVSHRIPDFFTKNYDHPIWEAGVLLKDMVYLRRKL